MKPSLTFLVRSRNGDAAALAAVGGRRATELGLAVDTLRLATDAAPGLVGQDECVTVLVPVEFAGTQHEAWCLLCQLSLLRCEIGFTVLVLGAAGGPEFQTRQRALLATVPRAPHRRRRITPACA